MEYCCAAFVFALPVVLCLYACKLSHTDAYVLFVMCSCMLVLRCRTSWVSLRPFCLRCAERAHSVILAQRIHP